MNDSQKRYTVLQINKYKSEAEEFDKKAKKNRWFIYGCVAAMIIAAQVQGIENVPGTVDFIADIIKFCGISFGLDSFRQMIGNMSKKSGLENMATSLEYQIQNDELGDKEENNYKGRGL